jgi:hypothetical protein
MIEFVVEVVLSVLWEGLLQLVGEALVELGWRTAGEPFRQRGRAHPVVAGIGLLLMGGVTLNRGLGLELGVANPTPNEVGIVVGYANNVLVDNANPQVSGGIQMGPNVCGSLGTARLCGEKEKK